MNIRKYLLAGFTVTLSIFVASFWLGSGEKAEPNESIAVVPEIAQAGDLSQWLAEYMNGAIDSQKLEAGIQLAKTRKIRMKQLIRTNPQRALNESISIEDWSALPDEVKAFVEEPFISVADVDVYIGCGTDFSEIDRWTTLEDGTKFETFIPPGNRFAGTRKGIQVEGIRLGEMGALWNAFDYEDSGAMERVDATTGTVREMYVILVDFSDHVGEPVDPTSLENHINSSVSQQIHEMSNHQSYINCVVNPKTYRLPLPISDYRSDHLPMHTDAANLVTADGVDLSQYDTVCVYFRRYSLITFAGYASLPGSKMWINGYNSDNVITHELGHNLGCYHASSWDVASTDPADPGGISAEYGDPLDIMGSGQIPKGHFHIQNKVRVGWLQDNNYTDVTTSGTYRVYRADHPLTDLATGEVRGLRINKGTNEYYWVGYRQLFTEYESIGRGVYILWQQDDPYGYIKSHLLDMTPGSSGGKFDGGLAMGRTYSDDVAGIHITPVARGGYSPNEYMDVQVIVGNTAGNNPPTATINGPATGLVTESMEFSISAIDPETDELAYSWDFGDGIVKENSPVVYHAFTGDGLKTVRCTVSDMKGGTVVAEKEVTISQPLEVWTNHGPIFATDLNDVTAVNGTLVTVGNHGFVATSTDGETWAYGNLGVPEYYNVKLESIIFDGTQYIAVGNWDDPNSTDWFGTIYTSEDASTWTRRYLATDPTIQLYDVAFGRGTSIAVGNNTTVLRSTNGTAWNGVTVSGVSGDMKSICFTSTAFTTVGETTGTGQRLVLFSNTNGFVWNNRTSYSGTGTVPFTETESQNGLLLASGPAIGIRYSPNEGYNIFNTFDANFEASAFAYGSGIYLAVGIQSGTFIDKNFVSNDGKNWTELPIPLQNDRTAAVFFNNSFITVGKGGSVWKSATISDKNSGWATWQIHYNDVLGINRDSEDDADGDGAENVLEYGLGTDPGDPSSVPIIYASKDESGYLYITIPRAFIAGDIEYVVEQTDNPNDPASWSEVDTVEETNTQTELTVRTGSPVSPGSPKFLRLRLR